MSKIIFDERDEALAIHYMLLTGQLATLSRCFESIFRLATEEDKEKKDELFEGYKAYITTELADVVCHIKKICKILDISFNEMMQLGDMIDGRYPKRKIARWTTRNSVKPQECPAPCFTITTSNQTKIGG